MKMMFSFLTLLAAVTNCSNSSGQTSEGAKALDDGIIEIFRPKEKYADGYQIKISAAEKYIIQDPRGMEFWSFRKINYKTGSPASENTKESADLISFNIIRGYGEFGDVYTRRFEDSGATRHGLSYRPQVVPSRPPELWKRIYTKPGLEDGSFYISCVPPIGPSSISAPEFCTMNLSLFPKKIGDRTAVILVSVALREERLSDWRQIEKIMINFVEQRVEYVIPAFSH